MAFSTIGKRFSSEINVTPLIDVLLVLLIIFMVIVPSVPHGLATSLPSEARSSAEDETPSRPVMVQIGQHSSRVIYRVDGAEIEKEQIRSRLEELMSQRTARQMFVIADPDLDYGVIADVVSAGQAAGVEGLGLVTPNMHVPGR